MIAAIHSMTVTCIAKKAKRMPTVMLLSRKRVCVRVWPMRATKKTMASWSSRGESTPAIAAVKAEWLASAHGAKAKQ